MLLLLLLVLAVVLFRSCHDFVELPLLPRGEDALELFHGGAADLLELKTLLLG